MASPSKEEKILELILGDSPLKHWHFEEIVKKSNTTRAITNKWLKRYVKEGLIKRIKKTGKFPYFTVGSHNHIYYAKKRIYMLNQLYKSGLIQDLTCLNNAKTIILFGSTAKGDWYKDSDIDLFIFGSTKGFDKHKYEKILKRNIETHTFEDKDEIKEVRTGLIKNVINGYVIKGSIQDFAEVS
jgi:predicted nucleotidyltransferase